MKPIALVLNRKNRLLITLQSHIRSTYFGSYLGFQILFDRHQDWLAKMYFVLGIMGEGGYKIDGYWEPMDCKVFP